MPESYKVIEGYKWMWDGAEYEEEAKAKEAEDGYTKENFETQIFEEEGKWLVYMRRVVTEVVVEGDAPV
jgi:hypothetical protein